MSSYDSNTKTSSGTDWQSFADKSVILDTEGSGKTRHEKPAKEVDNRQMTPNGVGAWPYR